MRADHYEHSVSHGVRLPDAAHNNALRVPQTSRAAPSMALTHLWPVLDEVYDRASWSCLDAGARPFGGDRSTRRSALGYDAKTAGRIIHEHVACDPVCQSIVPVLTERIIRPKARQHRAGKNPQHIKMANEASPTSRHTLGDDEGFISTQTAVKTVRTHFDATGARHAIYQQGATASRAYCRSVDLVQL